MLKKMSFLLLCAFRRLMKTLQLIDKRAREPAFGLF